MKQKINKFIYKHPRLNAIFWGLFKRAVFEIKEIEDAKIEEVSLMLHGSLEPAYIVNKYFTKYEWQKDERNE